MARSAHAPVSRSTRRRWAAGNADRAVRTSVNVWLWNVCQEAAEPATRGTDTRMGERHPFIRLVNREADVLVDAIRAAVHEVVREQPGRAQKGEIDRLLRKIAPKIERALNRPAKAAKSA